jgi:hypothetical protein
MADIGRSGVIRITARAGIVITPETWRAALSIPPVF